MDRDVVPGGLIAGVVVLTLGLLLSSRRHTAQQVGGEQVLGYGRAWKIPVALPVLELPMAAELRTAVFGFIGKHR